MGNENGFIPPEAQKKTQGFIPPEVKKKDEILEEDLSTPSEELVETSPKPLETNGEDIKSPLDFKPQEAVAVSTQVQAPTILDEEALAGADPLFMGGDFLRNAEDEIISSKQQKLREDSFRRSMKGTLVSKGDIPVTHDELSKTEAAKDYEMLITSKLERHIPESMLLKRAMVEKEQQLIAEIKGGELSQTESIKHRRKLVELEKQMILSDNNKKLFNPVTGETVDQDKAPQEAIEYDGLVSNLVNNKYSDIEDAYQASERAIHLYDHYEEELNKKVGDYQHITYMDLTNPAVRMRLERMPESEIKKSALLKERWVDSKANVEAISRAIMLNEDPSQVERGFGGGAGFHESVSKGFMEAIGKEETVTSTEGDFATRFVEVIRDAGKDKILTKAQVENSERTFTEKLGYGVGASIPIMAEIAVTTVVTEGVGSIPVVARRIKQFKDILGTTKAAKLLGNTIEQGVKGYVSFAPTEETGATGAGEGVAQGVMDTFLPEKLLGNKYGKLLNYAIRTVGGATAESIQEVAGQYTDALNENGYDAKAAFYDAFGRTPEERWENLALIGTTSLLFSGTFNSARLVITKDALQKEINEGKVPEQDVEAAKDIVSSMDDKIKSEDETPPITPEADATIEDKPKAEVSAVKEIKTKEDAIPTKKEEEKVQKEIKPESKPEPRPEGTPRLEEAGRIADIDKEQRKPEGEILEEAVEDVKPKEALKGEDLEHTQFRSGKKKVVSFKNVDTKKVLYTDKNGNKLHKHDAGFVTINKKGSVVSPKTTTRLVKEYENEFDYSKGKKAELNESMTGEEADNTIANESNNPEELADVIDRRLEQKESTGAQADTTKEGAIASVLAQGSVNPDSYMHNTGLNRKNVKPGIKLHYFRKDGKALDILAEEATESSKGFVSSTDMDAQGINITEQDIVDFLDKYPNTRNDYYKEFGMDEITEQAKNKFREVTGLEPSKKVIDLALGRGLDPKSTDTKESILKSLKDLPEGHATNEIFKRAVESGVNEDQEVKEAISNKAKEYKEYQNKLNEELDIGEDIDLPFQKGSRKSIAGKKYLGGMINTLKKAIPGLEVEFDEGIDGFGTIRDGKVVINPKKASTDTPIHEFAHVWTKILKAKNNTLYKTGIRLVKNNQELMDYVESSRPDLVTDNDIAEEALVIAIGEDGVDFFNTKLGQSKLRRLLAKVYQSVRKFFGIKKSVDWREMSEMSLKDFTKLASGELLGKTPLTTVTAEDVKNIMSEKLILDSIIIDSNILSEKGRDTIGKAKDFTKGLLMSKGKLPQFVANLDNNTRSAIESITSEAGNDVKIFNNILKEHIKENNLSTKEVEKLMIGINDVLTGENTVNSLGIQNTELALGIAAMRNTVDKLSEVLVNSGYIEGDIIATINENMGMYMRRSYEIHKAKPKTVSAWIDSLNKHTPEVVARAKEFIVDQYGLSKVDKINFKNRKDGTYKVTLQNEFGHESSSVIMDRADIVAILQEGNPTMITDGTVKELDIDSGSIKLDEAVNPKKYGINFELKEEDITEQLNKILIRHLGKESVFHVAGLNKKDISILKDRKDIPKEIRDLLGEIKDPAANYMETVSKMATLIEYSKFLHRLKKEGEGTLVWSKEDKPKGLDIDKISAENNPRWKPLDGMYTTKQFLSAMEHFEKEALVEIKGAEKANSFAMLLNTLTKSSLTKWNIPSNFRNHYGAVMMTARMGYFNPIQFAKAYSDYWKGTKASDSKDFDRAEFNLMKSYGLIDDSVGYQTYKDSLRRAMKTSSFIKKNIDKFSKTKLGEIANAPREFMDKMYLAPDAAAKMFLFREMKKDYTKAYPELTEDQINEKVSDIVKDTMPTFSKMSKGAKALSRNPIFGAFSSFTTEVVRNYVSQVRLINQEFKDYKESKNPHLKKLIDKKITGLIAMSIMVPAIATTLKAIIGISDDDDDAIRSVAPEWEKNSWKLYLGKGKDGSITGVDLSYVDPLAVMSKPLYAFIHGVTNDDMSAVDTAWETMKEAADQFTGEEPLFKAMWESASNTDTYGRPIAKPLHGEQWKRATHVINVLKPKFIDNFRDAKKAYIDEKKADQEGFGKKYDPMTFTFSILGFGVRDRDILKSVGFKISGEIRGEEGVNDAQNIYKYSDDKSQEDLDKANSELAKIFNEHLLNIEAARVTGASEVQIRKMLNQRNKSGNRYIPSYWANQLSRKQFIPIRAERKRN